jgi:hypothetical protein
VALDVGDLSAKPVEPRGGTEPTVGVADAVDLVAEHRDRRGVDSARDDEPLGQLGTGCIDRLHLRGEPEIVVRAAVDLAENGAHWRVGCHLPVFPPRYLSLAARDRQHRQAESRASVVDGFG